MAGLLTDKKKAARGSRAASFAQLFVSATGRDENRPAAACDLLALGAGLGEDIGAAFTNVVLA